jgi:hypothetical protein
VNGIVSTKFVLNDLQVLGANTIFFKPSLPLPSICIDKLGEVITTFLVLGCSICEDRVNHHTNDTKSKHSSPADISTPHYYLKNPEFQTPSCEGLKMFINISSPLDLVFAFGFKYTKRHPICKFNKSNILLVFVQGNSMVALT